MRLNKSFFAAFLASMILFAGAAWATEVSSADLHPYTQLFSIQTGTFRPTAISLSNSNYRYDYVGNSLNSYLVESGWSLKLFHLLGAVYLQENLALSTFKGTLPSQPDNLSLFMLGIDTRIKHAWEWFPLRAVIPFVEGGFQYSLFSQSGPSDFESAQGSVGNIVAGAGIDLWINAMLSPSHDSVNRYNAIPVFLTAKVNRVLGRNTEVNLGSTTFLAGLTLGI